MLNEKLILKEIRNGNKHVFEKLFHKHYHSLVKFANHFLLDRGASEDIVQGVFLYLWENSEKLQIKSSVKAYLFEATKNSCLNHLKALKIKDKHQIIYLEALLNTSDKDTQHDSELIEKIKSILEKLPQQMQQVFYKKYFDELTIKEIAKELNLSENTVKVQLHRGRHSVRQMLDFATGIFLIF